MFFHQRSTGLLRLILTITASGLLTACEDGKAARGSLGERGATNRYFVDVRNGQLITAHTVGRDPIRRREHVSALDRPRMPDRPTIAPPETGPRDTGSGPAVYEDTEVAITKRDRATPATTGTTTPPAVAPAPAPEPVVPSVGQGVSIPAGRTSTWAILLRAFGTDEETSVGHEQLAKIAAEAFAANAPDLRSGMWIHSDEEGSLILYGTYESLEDTAAREDLRKVKLTTVQDKFPYAMAHMARIIFGSPAGDVINPFDLRALRKQHPNVVPLYSLDVAAWMAEDDAGFMANARSAEAYARQLRARGYEAYFYHSVHARITSVTVGKFDRTVIDPVSGLYGQAVRTLIEQFPKRLMNGEEFIDPRTGKPQEPHMVEVPKKLD